MATIHHLAQASLEVLQVIVSGKKVLQGKTWKKMGEEDSDQKGRKFTSEGEGSNCCCTQWSRSPMRKRKGETRLRL